MYIFSIPPDTGSGRYSSKYAFSGIVFCSDCGTKYRRLIRKRDSGKVTATWCCGHRIAEHNGICQSITLKETDLEQSYLNALKRLVEETTQQELMSNITKVVNKNLDSEIKKIADKIVDLQNTAIELHRAKKNGIITANEYESKVAELTTNLTQRENELKKCKELNAHRIMKEERMQQINELISNKNLLETFDIDIMKSLVKRIVVKSQNLIEIEFKDGTVMKENI